MVYLQFVLPPVLLLFYVSSPHPVLANDPYRFTFSVAEERSSAIVQVGSFALPNEAVERIRQADLGRPPLHLLNSAGKQYFALQQQSGTFTYNLTTVSRIDRESLCRLSDCKLCCATEEKCIIDLRAAITEGLIDPIIVTLVVHLEDVNDNVPKFSEPEKLLQIPENTPLTTLFELPVAVDPDERHNSLLSVQPYSLSFPRASDNLTFEVRLQSFPRLLPSGAGSAGSAGGGGGGGVSVGSQSWRILGNATSTMPLGYHVRERPVLALKRPLDREVISSFAFELRATDGGRLTGSTQIRVTVLDVNDNSPLFSQSAYAATIPESHDPYTTILTVSAMDPDEGPNGEVEYDLSSAPRNVRAKFRVDPKRGDLQLTEALDFESEKYYEFPIIARDLSKTNPRTSEATLQIYGARIARCCDYENKFGQIAGENTRSLFMNSNTLNPYTVVEDVNDVVPRAEIDYVNGGQRQWAEIFENRPASSFVAFVYVCDEDSGQAGLQGIQCQIRGNDKFRLEPYQMNLTTAGLGVGGGSASAQQVGACSPGTAESRTFKLVTATELDREASSEEKALLLCSDSGHGISLTGTATATVVVKDVNDWAPQFSINHETCNCIRRGPDMIEPVTGVQSVESLPYAARWTIAGVFSCSGQYENKVLVNENNRIGEQILQLYASDRDDGANGLVTYEFDLAGESAANILGPPANPVTTAADGCFQMDPAKGKLIAKCVLDREQRDVYRFRIGACDNAPFNRKCSYLTLGVNVTDVNDNAPVFTGPIVFSLLENLANQTYVGKLMADDRDTGRNGALVFNPAVPATYSNDYIEAMNTLTILKDGNIYTKMSLDRELTDTYSLLVVVSDQGQPLSNSASATITIKVLDQNDNPPVILFPAPGSNAQIVVSYMEEVGSVVGEIVAKDDDIGDNSKLVYSITQGIEGEYFDIDPSKGHITVARQIPSSQVGTYPITVLVRDSGLPQQQTKTTFDIVINKSTPKRRPPPPTAPPEAAAHSVKFAVNGMDLESAPFKVLFSLLVLVILVVGIAGFSTCVYMKRNMPAKQRRLSMAFSRKRCDVPPTHQLGQKKSNTSDEQKLCEKLLPNRPGGDQELQPPPAAFYASGSPFLGNQFSTYIPLGAALDPDEIVALDASGMPITRDEYLEILNQELPATAQTLHEDEEAHADAGQPLEEMLEVVDEDGIAISIPIESDAPGESSQVASRPLKRSPDREQTPQSQSDQRDTPGSHKSSVDRGHPENGAIFPDDTAATRKTERTSSGDSSTRGSLVGTSASKNKGGSMNPPQVRVMSSGGLPFGFSSRQMSLDNLSLMGMRSARQRQMMAASAAAAAAGLPVQLPPPPGTQTAGPSPALLVRDARGKPIRLLRQSTFADAESAAAGVGASMRMTPESGPEFGGATRGGDRLPGYMLGPGGTRLRHGMGSIISLAGIRSNGQPIYCFTTPNGLSPATAPFATTGPGGGLRLLRSPVRPQDSYYPDVVASRGARKYLQVRAATVDKSSSGKTAVERQKSPKSAVHRAAESAASGSRRQGGALDAAGKSPTPSVRSAKKYSVESTTSALLTDQSPASHESSMRRKSDDMNSTPCAQSTPGPIAVTKEISLPVLSSADVQRAIANGRIRASSGQRRSIRPKLSEPLFDLQMLQQVNEEMRRQNSDEQRGRPEIQRGKLATITSQGTEEVEAAPEYENTKLQSATDRFKNLFGGFGKQQGKLRKGNSFQAAEQNKHLRKIFSVEAINIVGRQASSERSSSSKQQQQQQQQQQPSDVSDSNHIYETLCSRQRSAAGPGAQSQMQHRFSTSNLMSESVISSDGDVEEEAAARMRKRSMGVIKESAERLCTEDSSPAVDTPDSKPALSSSVSDLRAGAARSRAPKLAYAAHKFMSIPDPTDEDYEQELDARNGGGYLPPMTCAQLGNRPTITNCFGMPSFSIAADSLELGMHDMEEGLGVSDLGERIVRSGLFAESPTAEAATSALPPPIHPSRTQSTDTGTFLPSASATGLAEHPEKLVDLPIELALGESVDVSPARPENFDPIACLQSNWHQARLLDS